MIHLSQALRAGVSKNRISFEVRKLLKSPGLGQARCRRFSPRGASPPGAEVRWREGKRRFRSLRGEIHAKPPGHFLELSEEVVIRAETFSCRAIVAWDQRPPTWTLSAMLR